MRSIHRFTCVVAALVVASPAAAQQRSGAALDFTLGRHAVSGGTIAPRGGILADVFAAVRLRAASRHAIVAGIGTSGALAQGFIDVCYRTLRDGECAHAGNFAVINALIGIDRELDPGSVRLLAGPSYYNGAADRSLGLQGRVDLTMPMFSHVGLGLMAFSTLLPDHGGATLVGWGMGVGIAFR